MGLVRYQEDDLYYELLDSIAVFILMVLQTQWSSKSRARRAWRQALSTVKFSHLTNAPASEAMGGEAKAVGGEEKHEKQSNGASATPEAAGKVKDRGADDAAGAGPAHRQPLLDARRHPARLGRRRVRRGLRLVGADLRRAGEHVGGVPDERGAQGTHVHPERRLRRKACAQPAAALQ